MIFPSFAEDNQEKKSSKHDNYIEQFYNNVIFRAVIN